MEVEGQGEAEGEGEGEGEGQGQPAETARLLKVAAESSAAGVVAAFLVPLDLEVLLAPAAASALRRADLALHAGVFLRFELNAQFNGSTALFCNHASSNMVLSSKASSWNWSSWQRKGARLREASSQQSGGKSRASHLLGLGFRV